MFNPLSVFSTVEHFFQNFFVKAEKAAQVFKILEKDAPTTAPVLHDFWIKSLSLAAATSTTISDKGLNVPADTAEFTAIKTWLVSLKSLAVAVEADYKDVSAVLSATTPATTAPVLTIPATPVSATVK